MLGLKIQASGASFGLGGARHEFLASEKQVKKAMSLAVMDVVRWLRIQIAREIATRRNVNSRAAKEALVVRGFDTNRLQASINLFARGNVVKAVNAAKMRQTPKGVKGRGHFYEGAFLATMKSGHTGAFSRKYPTRLPGKKKAFPILEHYVVLSPGMKAAMEGPLHDQVKKRLDERFEHQLDRLLGFG